MSEHGLGSRLVKALTQPYKIPGYLKRQVDHILNTVEGSRIVWPAASRALLETFEATRPAADEILVLTHATLVSSGTERSAFAGLPNAKVRYPHYPGYSGAGQVIMVGDKVTRFQVGDRVAARCRHASFSVLKEERALPIPQGVTMEQACFLRLGIIALQGVRKAQIQLGERVAILGPGLIGQMAIQLAVAAGAYPVIAIGSSARRLPLAEEHGAHATINLAEGRDALDSVRADVTIDVTGSPEAIHDAVRCTRPGGRIILLGSSRGISRDVDFNRIRQAGISLIGAHITSLPRDARWPGWWPEHQEGKVILRLLADGRLNVDRLLTDQVFPPEAELFYRRLVQGDPSILAAVFRWDWLPDRQRFAAPRREALEKGRVIQAVRGPQPSPAAPPSPVASPEERLDGNLRVGLIGCGEIAVRNARAVQAAPNTSIAMVMDVNPAVARDMAKRHQVPYTTEIDELLARNDVDAVLISTPHHLHAPLTIQAARHAKHVMVEKPMSTTLADADAMIAACREAGVKLSVIYCQRYLPYVQKARAMIEQGAIGELLGVHLMHYLDKPRGYWMGGRTGRIATDWRVSKEKSGGGILVFNLVHYLDMIRYLTSLEVTRVYGDFGTFDSPVETEDTISITLRYGDRLIGNVTAASCVRGAVLSHQQLRIWGTEGQIIVGEPFQFYSLHQFEGYNPGEWHTLTEWEWGIERREYVQRFARAVLCDEEPEISGQDGRAVQAIVEAVYTSKELQKPIEIETV